MEKIEFKDFPITDTPIDADNLNLLQENIENEIIHINEYSTTEKRIGTFSNGKPLYNKIINSTLNSAVNSWKLLDNSLSEQFVVRYSGYIYDSINNAYYMLPFDTATTHIWFKFRDGISVAHNDANYNGVSLCLIIEYTKTTD